jgi:hypothetical protein
MAIKTVFITSGTTYVIPADFVSLVSVEAIGGGGSGRNTANGGGGGGGGYAYSNAITGLAPGQTTFVSIGAGGAGGRSAPSNGGQTWFNTTNTAPSLSTTGVLATGGVAGASPAGGAGGAGTIGTVLRTGGTGGTGLNTAPQQIRGGGGGAAGPRGNGANGGNAHTANPGGAGAGGGGDGGSAGGNGTVSAGGRGGNGFGGTGGGAGATGTPTAAVAGTAGTSGGGGGGFATTAGIANNGANGGTGSFWTATAGGTAGSGGGGGGTALSGAGSTTGGDGALYGGGGGGGGTSGAGLGGGGIVVFTYDDTAPVGRYWVGGTGSWGNTANWSTTSGGPGGASVPTSVDNVFINLAGPYTINHGFNPNFFNLTVSGANVTLTGAAGDLIQCFGSMTLAASTVWTVISGTPGRLFFSDGGSNRNINFNGATIVNPITFNLGGATTATLTGPIATSSTLNSAMLLNTGTLNTSTSNHSITTGNFTAASSATLTLNGSTLTCTASQGFTGGGTINAGTSTIVLSAENTTFAGNGLTYNNVSFTNTAAGFAQTLSITGANTFARITVAGRSAAGIKTLSLGANQTITTLFTVQSGVTNPNTRVLICSDTFGTARTITSASNTIFGADFRDITAAGAASWSDSSRTGYWGDCKGNTGITFAAGRTVYWNNAAAAFWSSTSWALTTTGTPAVANFPLAQDTAAITNAGAVPAEISNDNTQPYNVGTIDMSARTSALSFFNLGVFASILGNLITGTGITYTGGGGGMNFAGRTTQSLTSAGRPFNVGTRLSIFGSTTTVNLTDAFVSNADIENAFGTLNTQNNNVTVNNINFNGVALTLGTSTVTLTGTGTVWSVSGGVTVSAASSTIACSGNGAIIFGGAGKTYGTLSFTNSAATGTITINGSNTFTTVSSARTGAYSVLLQAGTTTTVTNWNINGSAGNIVTLGSTTTSAATLAKAGGGVVVVSYYAISYSTASPTNTWSAEFSTAGTAVTNWIFPPPASGNFMMLFI